jgi:hypothetical protein
MPKRIPIPIFLLIVLTLSVIASGCGGANHYEIGNALEVNNAGNNTSLAYGNDTAEEAAWSVDQGDNSTEQSAGSGVNSAETAIEGAQRIVIMSARMSISSRNPEAILDSVASLAERAGGYVVSSNLRQKQGRYSIEVPEANITIRVPAERLQEVIETIKGMAAEVIYSSQWGQDVTSEYTDLQSRLTNLEEAAAQLQTIMDAADETEDVLDVYEELTKVNEEAELIRGQIQYYDQAAALSSIELTIIQILDPTPTPTVTPTPTPRPTATPKPWLPGETFEEAGEDVTHAFQKWINNVIRFFVFSLPTFIFRAGPWLLVLFFGGRWAFRRFYKPAVKDE